MEEILKNGIYLITAAILSVGMGTMVILLIVFGILNKTLHQIKETLNSIQKNFECKYQDKKRKNNRNEE